MMWGEINNKFDVINSKYQIYNYKAWLLSLLIAIANPIAVQ